MTTWITATLHEAEVFFMSQENYELADRFRRLAECPQISDLHFFRDRASEKLSSQVFECDTAVDLQECLYGVTEIFPANHCTVHLIREVGSATYEKKVITTYSKDWAVDSVRSRLATVDPIIAKCKSGSDAFYWDEISKSDPFSIEYFRAAEKCGIGPSGFTTVGENKYGDQVAVTLASKSDKYYFRKQFEDMRSDFEDLAPLLIEAFTEIVGIHHSDGATLTIDQLRVLRELAMGVSPEIIQQGPFLYGSFSNIESSILMTLCARNLTQAVAIASEIGILRDLPYDEKDFVSATKNFSA